MDNIVKFPSHIAEKERELTRLEFDLQYQRMLINRERSKIEHDKIRRRSDIILSFAVGIIVMGIIMMLMHS
jgi:hypothetical protein